MDKWKRFYRSHKKMVWVFGIAVIYAIIPIPDHIKNLLTPLVMAAAAYQAPKNISVEDQDEWE